MQLNMHREHLEVHFLVQHCGAVPGTEAITTLLLEEPESYKNICCILTHQIKGVYGSYSYSCNTSVNMCWYILPTLCYDQYIHIYCSSDTFDLVNKYATYILIGFRLLQQ